MPSSVAHPTRLEHLYGCSNCNYSEVSLVIWQVEGSFQPVPPTQQQILKPWLLVLVHGTIQHAAATGLPAWPPLQTHRAGNCSTWVADVSACKSCRFGPVFCSLNTAFSSPSCMHRHSTDACKQLLTHSRAAALHAPLSAWVDVSTGGCLTVECCAAAGWTLCRLASHHQL